MIMGHLSLKAKSPVNQTGEGLGGVTTLHIIHTHSIANTGGTCKPSLLIFHQRHGFVFNFAKICNLGVPSVNRRKG
jgi:hypothetical protein